MNSILIHFMELFCKPHFSSLKYELTKIWKYFI